ncbi:DUF642 domain-containing protein [Streptomyces sp. NPDC012751]|uniref:DUF642 domain-containing protein n=1 Tax=unclassified Streptomyces TaxID=2593676 RepID=UPI0004C4879A|nr:DUF642 domain-containing protein [Streptomyces sp. NRRL S-31]
MKRVARGALLAAALLAFSLPASPAGAADDIVRNGEFEAPFVPAYGLATFAPYTTPGIPEWRVAEGTVDVYSTQLAGFYDQAVDLNGGSRGAITQVIRTTPGKTVHLSWYHTRNTHPVCVNEPPQSYDVSVEGAAEEVFTTLGRIGNWQPKELTFRATRSRYNLTFSSDVQGVCGALISDVQGEAITNS